MELRRQVDKLLFACVAKVCLFNSAPAELGLRRDFSVARSKVVQW